MATRQAAINKPLQVTTLMINMAIKQVVIEETSNGYNSYDKYGNKTGSYKKTLSGYNSYKTDSYGRTTRYDKYGNKTGSYR